MHVYLLPYVEASAKYERFDLGEDVHFSPRNAGGRIGDVPVFLCPAEVMEGGAPESFGGMTSIMGRSNYFANLGTGARWDIPLPRTAGMFHLKSRVRVPDVRDGTSFTAFFAEIHRGGYPAFEANPPVVEIPAEAWDQQSNADTEPVPVNRSYPTGWQWMDMGTAFHRGFPWHCFYNHTAPPNWADMDCARIVSGDYVEGTANIDRIHLASRSYHRGGVNVVFVDGSVRFVSDRISLRVWRGMGTRSGHESIGSTDGE